MKNKLPFLLFLSVVLVVGCGDDSSSNVSEEPISSSSEMDPRYSSSTKSESSSSTEEETSLTDEEDLSDEDSFSDETTPTDETSLIDEFTASSSSTSEKKYRAAVLEDLEKNMELKLFDVTIYLSTGSKQGIFALRIPDELWLMTYADFANGELIFNEKNTGVQFAETDAAKEIVNKLKKGFKLSFFVDTNGIILYSVDDSKESNEAVKASVSVSNGTVSKAENIKNKIYTCEDGDTTRIFTFFDNSYILEDLVSEKVVYGIGGRYDIQRSKLLMLPTYYPRPVNSMYVYTVTNDNKIKLTDGETTATMNCTVEDVDYEYWNPKNIVGEWVELKDGIEWNFSIKSDGTFELKAFEGEKIIEAKSGVWETYGYYLMMRNNACIHPDKCTKSIYGVLQLGTLDNKTGKISGFSFIHSDTDEPKIPISFNAPEYID